MQLPETKTELKGVSTADSQKFYEMLLDAKNSVTAHNLFDLSEQLLITQKNSAQQSLENLWELKKNLNGKVGNATLEILINHYQSKMDKVRNREDQMRKIGADSRKLLEQKRSRDSEIARVSQSIDETQKSLNELQQKLEKLKVRQQELLLIESELKKQLQENETSVVNSLYEIIISDPSVLPQPDEAPAEDRTVADSPAHPGEPEVQNRAEAQPFESPIPQDEFVEQQPQDEPEQFQQQQSEDKAIAMQTLAITRSVKVQLPKSVVRTKSGKVLGEYFYMQSQDKPQRKYIFNTAFLAMQLARFLAGGQADKMHNLRFDLIRMCEDCIKRCKSDRRIQLPVCTNEVVNSKSLRALHASLQARQIDDVRQFTSKLNAKLNALAANLSELLKEQLVL